MQSDLHFLQLRGMATRLGRDGCYCALALLLLPSAALSQTPISCGQSIASSISVIAEKDTYSYVASAGETITVRMVKTSGNISPYLELRNSSNVLVTGAFGKIDRTISAAGQYQIVAYDYGNNDTGNYQLFLERVSSPCSAASALCGQSSGGAIAVPGEIDGFSLQGMGKDDTVVLRMVRTAGSLNEYLELYDGGVLVASAFDTFTKRLTSTGPYLVLAHGYNGTDTGSYQLFVERLGNPCNATPLSCGQPVAAAIAVPGETDGYILQGVGSNDTIIANMLRSSGTLSEYLELYDGTGLVAGAFDTLNKRLIGAGPHLLLVHGYNGTDSGSYGLSLQRLNGGCSATALTCGTIHLGSVDIPGALIAHTLATTAGDVITLRLESTTTNFNPRLQLYDPDGVAVTMSYPYDEFTGTLSKTGNYTVLATYWTGSSLTGGYRLATQRVKTPCSVVSELPCGSLVTDAISAAGELDTYALAAAAGDVVTLRVDSATTNFTPRLQLYDPDGIAITVPYPYDAFTGSLGKSGIYTVLIRYSSGSSRTGGYRLATQRSKSPCNVVSGLPCGSVLTGTVGLAGELVAYTLSAAAGDAITLRLDSDTTNFTPRFQLYDPDGVGISVSYLYDLFTGTLSKTGDYTVLVSYLSGSSLTGDYRFVTQRLKGPCNATSLACGQNLSAAISVLSELDAYDLQGLTVGDTVALRMVANDTTLTPHLELYDGNGARITSNIGTITTRLNTVGPYTVLAHDWQDAELGSYQLAFQRPNNPCNSTSMTIGSRGDGTLSVGQTDAYNFSATAGQDVTICIAAQPGGALNPFLELYDANGTLLASNSRQIQYHFETAGTFNLLVRGASGSGPGAYTLLVQNGILSCSSVDLQNPSANLTAPNGGEIIDPGSSFLIRWTSSDNVGVTSQEIRVSADGGVTFPTLVANPPGSATSYTWTVPAVFRTSNGRVRVIVRDAAGNQGQDSSERDFIVPEAPPSQAGSLTYDAIGQLIRIEYPSGSVTNYTYDPAGNRTNETTTAVAAPQLVVSPGGLNFGTVAPGANAQASFSVSNGGDSTLTGTASISGGPFTITAGSSFNISGGSSAVTVRFSPVDVGSFTNSVVFSSNGGSSTNVITGNGGTAPVASFTATPTSGKAPLTVNFTDLSSGAIVSRLWSFGDSSSDTGVNPVHTYSGAGNYTVSLTVSGSSGSNTMTRSNYISVAKRGGHDRSLARSPLPTDPAYSDGVTGLTILGLSGAAIGKGSEGSSRALSDGEWEITGSGCGFGEADCFYMEQRKVRGDMTVVARINSLTDSGPEPLAGLMIREGLTDISRFVALATSATDQYRGAWYLDKGTSVEQSVPLGTYAYPNAWVALERRGDAVTLRTSDDGIDWMERNTLVLPGLARSVSVGVFVSSGDSEASVVAVLSDYSLRSGSD